MQDTILRYVQAAILAIIAGIAAFRNPGVVPQLPPPPPPPIVVPQPPAPPPPAPLPIPIPAPQPKAAVARVQFGNASCTCTFIGPEREDGRLDVLCAAHCASGRGQFGTVYCQDSRKVKVKVTAADRGKDILWLRTEDKFIHPYAILASKNAPVGTRLWHEGYGVDKPHNHEEGVVIEGTLNNGMFRIRINVSSGDSGSGLFGVDDGLVYGTVYGYDNRSPLAAGIEGINALRPR